MCAFLVDVSPGELSPPLSVFQAKRAKEKETLQLLASINKRLEKPLTPEQLDTAFEKNWSGLAGELEKIVRNHPDDLPCHIANEVESYPPGSYKLKVRFRITNLTDHRIVLHHACFNYSTDNGLTPLHPPGRGRASFNWCPLKFQNERPEAGIDKGEQTSVWIAYDEMVNDKSQVEEQRKKRTLGVLDFRVASPKLTQLIRLHF